MPSKQERMKALLAQFKSGQIDSQTYQAMLDSLLGIGAVDQSIADSVIKGDVEQSTGKIEGGLHVHVGERKPGALPREVATEAGTLIECAHCAGAGVCKNAKPYYENLPGTTTWRHFLDCSGCGRGAPQITGHPSSVPKGLSAPVCHVCKGRGRVRV